METLSCGTVTANASPAEKKFVYATKEKELFEKPADYKKDLSTVFSYAIKQKGKDTGAVLKFQYGTYIKSQEPICFTGDFFPFLSPSCSLLNSGKAVNTKIHNAHEYAIDFNILELKVNENWVPTVALDPKIYTVGATLPLTT